MILANPSLAKFRTAASRFGTIAPNMPDMPPQFALTRLSAPPDLWSRNFEFPFPAGPLYHYTTTNGLLGSGRLWATHTGFLNDPGEATYGAEVLKSCIRKVVKSVYFQEIKDTLEMLQNILSNLPFASSYVTCFTEISDSLVLWNMYTPDSGGIAIEFDSVRLFAIVRNAYALARVCYDPSAQVQLIEGHITSWIKTVEDSYRSHSGLLSGIISVMMGEIVARLCCVLPSLKSPAYAHEQEWRLIAYITGVEQVLFRTSMASLLPYIELGVGARLPISGLVIGPNCSHPTRTKLSLEMIMEKSGYLDCPIRLSGVPYVHSFKG
jgi:hypothetical protein